MRLTEHAVDRYIERVKPGCDRSVAIREIQHLLSVRSVLAIIRNLRAGDIKVVSQGVAFIVTRSDAGELYLVTCWPIMAPLEQRRLIGSKSSRKAVRKFQSVQKRIRKGRRTRDRRDKSFWEEAGVDLIDPRSYQGNNPF